jgi:uncharacterized membrane protein
MSQSSGPTQPQEGVLTPPGSDGQQPIVDPPVVAPELLPTTLIAAPKPAQGTKRRSVFRRKWRLRPRDFATLLRGTTVLAIIGACVAALVMQLSNKPQLPEFVNQNQLDKHARMLMLGWLSLGAAIGLLTVLVLFLFRPRAPTSAASRTVRVLRTARLLSPLVLPGVALPLLRAHGWDALSRASGCAFLALIAELCARKAVAELLAKRLWLARLAARVAAAVSRVAQRLPRILSPTRVLVLLAACFYVGWMSYGTILQHREFGTAAFDLGNYDNMFFNLLHGHPFRCPSVLPRGGNWSMLSNHAEFTMLAVLPFYAIRPGSETLLVLQAVALATGVFPVYRFASRRLPRSAALVLALAYLLYAPMHQANFYDVHFQPFAATLTLWTLDMLDARRPVLFALFFLLALGCREDVPIGLAVVGAFLLFTGKHTRAALVMTLVSAAYFVIIKFVVMPHFGSWWFAEMYKDLYPSGENSYGGVVKTLLTNPAFVWRSLINTDKIVLFLLISAPLAFLPLRRGLLWMSLLPAAPFTLLTTGYSPTVQISFQYVCLYIPFVFLAAALALGSYASTRQGRTRLWGALGGVAMATFLTTRIWGAMPPGDKFKGGFRDIPEFKPLSKADKQKAQDIRELAAMVPKSATVAVSDMEHPHVSTRLDILVLRSGYEGADYILYSENGGGAEMAREALGTGKWEVVVRRPASRMALLKKKRK